MEPVNNFGRNRGLELEQLVLTDQDGEQLVVRARQPNTFPNLNPAEKKRVESASRWKDLNRIPDRVYSSAPKTGSLPPASHVKQHEHTLNAQLDDIQQVFICS